MSNPLQNFMDQHGLKDAEVAARLGWHLSTVNKVRRDRHTSLSLQSAVQLEALTGTPASAWHERLKSQKKSSDDTPTPQITNNS